MKPGDVDDRPSSQRDYMRLVAIARREGARLADWPADDPHVVRVTHLDAVAHPLRRGYLPTLEACIRSNDCSLCKRALERARERTA